MGSAERPSGAPKRPERAKASGQGHRGRVFLTCHLLINALLIMYVAASHTFGPSVEASTYGEGVLRQHQVFVEAVLLALPGWLLGVTVGAFLPRLGVLLGTVAITLTPVWYYADLTSYLIIGERLFSRPTYEIVFSIRPWLSDFTTLTSYAPLVWAFAIWAVVEAVSLYVSRRVSSRFQDGGRGAGKVAVAAALIVLVVPLGIRLARPRAVLDELRTSSERHPICATALIEHIAHDAPKFPDMEEIRLQSHLLTHQPAVEEYKQRYFDVTLTDGPQRPLDVVVVIAESLRYDALSPKSSPNLWELRQESITSQLHFPGGNTSFVAFQVFLFGFDPAFSIFDTGQWPPLLNRLMDQAGYYQAFVGTGGFWHEMDRFLNSVYYDFYRLDMTFPYHERDRKLVEQAEQILNREGPFRDLGDRPVFVLLYLHSTHYSYHSAPEDQVFTPAAGDPLPTPPWDAKTLSMVRNRYRNSVHAVDRVVAPLLDRNRIIIVTGDHGETFQEDGRLIHGSALSFPQTRTPLLIHVPDGSPAELPGPTSHADLMPTLLEALGISVNDPAIFAGRSLLDPEEAARPVPRSLRDLTTKKCALYGSYSQRGDSTLMFHFDIDVWEPRFKVLGAYDELANRVTADAEDAAAFEAEMEIWFDQLLGGKGGKVAEDPVPGLVALLDSGTVPTQRRALKILRDMGPRAKGAVPALEASLRERRAAAVRDDVAQTLVAILKDG